MQQLHAYWRMEYIAAPRYPERMERPFTELPALGDDRVALIVHRTPLSYLILNRFPYNPGHLLAVPFREVREIGELRADERADLFDTLLAGQRILTAAEALAGLEFDELHFAGGSGASSADKEHLAVAAETQHANFAFGKGQCADAPTVGEVVEHGFFMPTHGHDGCPGIRSEGHHR
jgi:ATP adenylyltransferase